jgi:endonuclease/exonuclease/phosphatase family metal-dependent hydrolase
MKINVCTYNIRCDCKADGVNCFDGRKGLILREFPKYNADVIGFQEVLPHVREWLEKNMPEYTFVGTGRNADYDGEHVCTAFRSDLFQLVSLDTYWLSDTPFVPGSRFGTDQSFCPRTVTAAVLITRKERKIVRMYNTHLDHVGSMSQAQGMTLVLSRIAADEARYPGTPVILTGDFNIYPDNPIIAGISKFSVGGRLMTDVTADVGGTFHAYKPETVHSKIDYIFTTAECDASRSQTLTECEDGVYLSDHYPVVAELEI